MNQFEKVYLQILNQQKSPTTFTPEELLNDIRNKCFYSTGEFLFYTVDELQQFSDNSNKALFKIFINQLKYRNDFGILVIYFASFKDLNDILNTYGYFNPHKNYPGFSMKAAYQALKKYFQDTNKSGTNFNSIDVCPQLGCVIGINGTQVKTNRDFEQVLDHQLNHYFENMNIHYGLTNKVDTITNTNNQQIIQKLINFYHMDFSQKQSFIDDLKYHLFNEKQFRSMCADVFHEILRYNENHFQQLNYHEFITDIENCDYLKYPLKFQDYIIFCWICKKLSVSRWRILLTGIKEACLIKKNIFQKFFIKGRDIFRNFILNFK